MRACHSAGPGLVDRGALGIDRDGDRHVLHLELVDRFHAEVFERDDARVLDRLGDQVGRAADGHQVDGLVLLIASMAAGPRSALPTMPSRPVSASIWRVNLSMRVAVVGPAGPTTSSRTGSTGPT